MIRRVLLLLGALAALAGCAAPSVSVGSKPFAENRILAEMFVLMLRDAGLRVQRRFPTGETEEVFAALQAGAVDVYPEYTGTALGLLGLPPIADADAAWAEVLASFQAREIGFLPRLGYESRYAVLVTAERAAALELEALEDLAPHAPALSLGVTETYARRPRDGLGPLLDRFGFDFAAVGTAEGSSREALYAGLLDGGYDVIVGFDTDPEIADFGLVELVPSQPFFPAYEAAPLVSRRALARAPAREAALARLAGRLDLALMRRLIDQVEREGRAPDRVAAEALAELGLIEGGAGPRRAPFLIAAGGGALGGQEANRALRAVRRALPERGVAFVEATRPVAAIPARGARLALAPAIDMFRVRGGAAEADPGLEAIAAVGSNLLHALAPRDRPAAFAAADTVATGPFGSPSHKAASVYAARRRPPPRVRPRAGAGAAAAAVAAGEADAALVLATPGRADVAEAVAAHPGLRLVESLGWWRGAVRLELPFLREAVIPAGTYAGQATPVPTAAMQLVLIGPAPPRRTLIGRQGPGAYTEALYPVTDETVRRINAELGPTPGVDPGLRRAAALRPQVRGVGDRLNPHPDRALISVGLIGFALWAVWLLRRA